MITRREREVVQIGPDIFVSINWARKGEASLAIVAPRGVKVERLPGLPKR
jgi:sRNA-binding carbon storage regulator CsrA